MEGSMCESICVKSLYLNYFEMLAFIMAKIVVHHSLVY